MKEIENILSNVDFETVSILKKVPNARAALGELKGVCETLPNMAILINTLALQEAKDSSEVENIITTHDEVLKSYADIASSVATKEVERYRMALGDGFSKIQNGYPLTNNVIISMYQTLENNNGEFRQQSGTVLKNDATGEIVHTPPQDPKQIRDYMTNLEAYINPNDVFVIKVLIQMMFHDSIILKTNKGKEP